MINQKYVWNNANFHSNHSVMIKKRNNIQQNFYSGIMDVLKQFLNYIYL